MHQIKGNKKNVARDLNGPHRVFYNLLLKNPNSAHLSRCAVQEISNTRLKKLTNHPCPPVDPDLSSHV